MISYESSKWYVKMWRTRWYLYAIFLYILNYINIDIGLDYIFDGSLGDSDKEKLRRKWKDIMLHVELSKMYKFSSK